MRACIATLLFCVLSLTAADGQVSQEVPAPTSKPQAVALVNAAYAALGGAIQVTDGTLTGTVIWPSGSDQFTGNATIQFKGAGESRMDLSLGSFQRSEIWNDVVQGAPDGELIDGDGTPMHFAPHNCWGPSNWFSPLAVVASMLSTDAVLTYVGAETQNGVAVDHLRAVLSRGQSTSPAKLSALIRHLGTVDVYLDKASHLPWSIKYNTHPNDDLQVDIPVEIRFASYRPIQGVAIPFRFQRLIQNELNLDFTVTNAVINTGISDSAFVLQ